MLALVIGCVHVTDNIGKIVTADRKVENGFFGPDGCEYAGGAGAWLVTGEGLKKRKMTGELVDSDFSYVAEKHLLPINPLSDPLDVTHKEELHA